jgi:hypothetical protein
MASDQIRIVVAGHTGLNKLRCIQERIIPFLLGRDPNWQRANAGGDAQECARITFNADTNKNAFWKTLKLATFRQVYGWIFLIVGIGGLSIAMGSLRNLLP